MTEKEIKKMLRTVIRNHKSFRTAEECRYCKDRVKKIKEWAWK